MAKPAATSAAVVLAAIASLVLSSCNGVVFSLPSPSATSSDPSSVTPNDSASPSSDPSSDVLFTVTATTTDSTGDQIALTLTGHASQPWDAVGREAIKTSFETLCTASGGVIDDSALGDEGATLMVLDVTSTPAGRTLPGPIELQLGSPYYYQVASGDGVGNPNDNPCYPGYQISATGAVTAITSFSTGGEPDLAQWRTGRYGFSSPDGSPVVFSNCQLTLTQLATAAHVSDIDGWTPEPGTESDCAIGYQGE